MLELVAPHPCYQRSFLAAADEFVAAGEPTNAHIPALRPEAFIRDERFTREGLEDPDVFADFAAVLRRMAEPDGPRPEGCVPSTERWMVVAGEYVGRITLRHELTDLLLTWGGHIGYSVRPSARRRGHATQALRLMLLLAAAQGIDPVLVTCDTTNEGSRRTIEANGGVYEDTREGKLRYWVPTTAPATPAGRHTGGSL